MAGTVEGDHVDVVGHSAAHGVRAVKIPFGIRIKGNS